jgi:hypothetical protein
VKISSIRREYRHPIRSFVYICFCTFTKIDRWLKVDHNYSYNMTL